jgi:hypothetical protein
MRPYGTICVAATMGAASRRSLADTDEKARSRIDNPAGDRLDG